MRGVSIMIRTLCCAAIFFTLFTMAQAQQPWPARPVRVIVPFVPGSFTDLAARAIANELTGQLGQQVIVENRTGAGGTIGADAVARSTPDGHTLLFFTNSLTTAPGLYPKLPYDVVKDFNQVSLVAESPSILVIRLQVPAKSVREFVELARAKPGEFTFGSGGQGSSAHLAMELFMHVTSSRMLHVPFKGVAASIAEVSAGRIDSSISSLASGAAQANAGKLRALGVTGKERSALLPAVPTFAEAGYPAYDTSYWWAMAAPAGTPPATIAQLNREIARAAEKPRLRELFVSQGASAVTSSPADLDRRVSEEIRVWKDLIARAGIKLE
jgi:tripartite-type tricarboxylate transporter receptor subunit TctC